MDPLTISLIMAGASAGIGAYQTIKGNKLAKSAVRPIQEIPSAATMYLQNAQAMAENQRLAGQSALEGQIQGNTAQTLRAGQESSNNPASLMALASATNANANNAMTGIGSKAAEMQQQNQRALGSAQLQYAGLQQKQFDVNQMDPYQNQINAAMAMKGAGMQNIAGGLDKAGAVVIKQMGLNANNPVVPKNAVAPQVSNQPNSYTGQSSYIPSNSGIPLDPSMIEYYKSIGLIPR